MTNPTTISGGVDLSNHYEKLRHEAMSLSAERVHSTSRGAGVLISKGIVGWISLIGGVYSPTKPPRYEEKGRGLRVGFDSLNRDLTEILAEMTLNNLEKVTIP